ncbi:MAG: glycosyl transferase [Lachnospiraceae bacterium]|nr:glycosyl transferase [Lachnospiraceae bacterium]
MGFVGQAGRILPDRLYITLAFLARLHSLPDLKHPKTFNEKLQWLKLNDRREVYKTMVDKAEVKAYVAERIGEEYIIPTLGIWGDAESIDTDKLPERFVLKCTHDSGSTFVISDKAAADWPSVKAGLTKCLKSNYYILGREWPYKDCVPRIIAEEYIGDGEDLTDYKFMCFNGKVKCTFVCTERFAEDGVKINVYDRDWELLPFERDHPRSSRQIPRPEAYEEMIGLAEKLAGDIPFVRIDFYNVGSRVCFGEITLYPGAGFLPFYPAEWDGILGSWLTLPDKAGA